MKIFGRWNNIANSPRSEKIDNTRKLTRDSDVERSLGTIVGTRMSVGCSMQSWFFPFSFVPFYSFAFELHTKYAGLTPGSVQCQWWNPGQMCAVYTHFPWYYLSHILPLAFCTIIVNISSCICSKPWIFTVLFSALIILALLGVLFFWTLLQCYGKVNTGHWAYAE